MIKHKIILIIPMLFLVMACASLQQTYDKATPDEKARLQISVLQKSLDAAFDSAKMYVTVHPEKQADWKAKIVPMFDMANKILRDAIIEGLAGKPVTPTVIVGKFMDKTVELRTILLGWGVTL